jgi:gas vesicle protein
MYFIYGYGANWYVFSWIGLIFYHLKKMIMSTNKLIAGILAGVAIGILIAPAKGSETRKKISSKAGDASDYLKDVVESIREKINQLADNEIDAIENAEAQINDALLT